MKQVDRKNITEPVIVTLKKEGELYSVLCDGECVEGFENKPLKVAQFFGAWLQESMNIAQQKALEEMAKQN